MGEPMQVVATVAVMLGHDGLSPFDGTPAPNPHAISNTPRDTWGDGVVHGRVHGEQQRLNLWLVVPVG